ncbi:MAG: PKD domain-containing protein, partial [Thermoplasmata archaeon]|nr:PKD domain-containing protein [Thermoplasmata archaeon]
PTLPNNATPTSVGTGNQLTFAVDSNDNIDVLGGSVFYRYGTSGGYTELVLIKAGSTYSSSITVNHTLTPIYYYFSFSDTSNNWNNATQSMITIVDDDKPEFVNDHSDTAGSTGKMFNFSLEFTDNIATDSAHVEYKFGSTGSVHVVTLTQAATLFKGSIIIPEATTQPIFYRFFFNDTTPANTNNNDWVQVPVTDSTIPQLVSGSGNIQATTGESFSVFGKFSDNIGLDLVKIYYTKTTTWLDKTITSDDGNYSITNAGLTIDTTEDDSNWQYYYVAKDAAENSVNYGTQENPFTITVIDNDKPLADAGADMDKILVDTQIEVTLDGAGSSDNIGIDAHTWTFMYNNQQQQLNGEKPKFTFSKAGFHTVTLNVTDAAGNWDTDTVEVNIYSETTPPNVNLDYPGPGSIIPDLSVTLRWSTDHPDANLVTYDVYWGDTSFPSLKKSGHSDTKLELTGLEDKATYYWKVQPKLGGTEGP